MEITGTKHRAVVGSLLQAPWAVGKFDTENFFILFYFSIA